ncbi:MAG: 4Fe-4S binding protein [Campylobacterales bacterium]|nr:4Fe-4S binding protein [Campylobacterales bacterium]
MLNALQSNGNLHIDNLKCLRAEYLYNTCSQCEQICPTDALYLANNKRFALYKDKCIDCNACIGVCPTEAITTKSFDANTFVLKFSATDETMLSCKKNTPCLRIFNVEQLIALGVRNEKVVCDMAHCEGCEINTQNRVQNSITAMIDEANGFLERSGTAKQIETSFEKIETRRRELFKRFAKDIHDIHEDFDAGDIFDTNSLIPIHRQLLQNTLKKHIEEMQNHTIGGSFSFTQNKTIEFNRCDNCGDCVQFCPTHALSYDSQQTRILFENVKCIACGICNDICKPNAFGQKEELDLLTMVFGRAEAVIQHRFELCTECKVSFPQKGDETICNRCKDFVVQNANLFTMAKDM